MRVCWLRWLGMGKVVSGFSSCSFMCVQPAKIQWEATNFCPFMSNYWGWWRHLNKSIPQCMAHICSRNILVFTNHLQRYKLFVTQMKLTPQRIVSAHGWAVNNCIIMLVSSKYFPQALCILMLQGNFQFPSFFSLQLFIYFRRETAELWMGIFNELFHWGLLDIWMHTFINPVVIVFKWTYENWKSLCNSG